MSVVSIDSKDTPEEREEKLADMAKARRELQATRDAIEKEYGTTRPVNRYRQP